MANSIDTNSTKSSIISGKATSVKKSIQKSAKAIVRPFKKLKKSLSTASTRSIRFRSSAALPISDNKTVMHDEEPSISSKRAQDDGESEPEVDLTPEEKLGMSIN